MTTARDIIEALRTATPDERLEIADLLAQPVPASDEAKKPPKRDKRKRNPFKDEDQE
jgi:FMN-dependent NADH-azoreductase